MSSVDSLPSIRPTHAATIVPHATLPRLAPTPPATQAVHCPRCQQTVALPDWASDGDLTECRGLLLRVSCDHNGCQLDRL
jgi:hypothetical protein